MLFRSFLTTSDPRGTPHLALGLVDSPCLAHSLPVGSENKQTNKGISRVKVSAYQPGDPSCTTIKVG